MPNQPAQYKDHAAVPPAHLLVGNVKHRQRSQRESEAVNHALKRIRREGGRGRGFEYKHRRAHRKGDIERDFDKLAVLKCLHGGAFTVNPTLFP